MVGIAGIWPVTMGGFWFSSNAHVVFAVWLFLCYWGLLPQGSLHWNAPIAILLDLSCIICHCKFGCWIWIWRVIVVSRPIYKIWNDAALQGHFENWISSSVEPAPWTWKEGRTGRWSSEERGAFRQGAVSLKEGTYVDWFLIFESNSFVFFKGQSRIEESDQDEWIPKSNRNARFCHRPLMVGSH